MKEYRIAVTEGRPDFRRSAVALIDIYAWGGEYRPRAEARLVYVPGDGFYSKLTAYEKNPCATYRDYMDPVYRDSCLEFFASYGPQGYINCEMNANGAILSAFGPDRNFRTPVREICGMIPEVKAKRYPDRWCVTVRVGQEIIKAVYGIAGFRPGDVIYGNFYKCGDDCEYAHYGSFAPVSAEAPDFHRPDCFAKMTLV